MFVGGAITPATSVQNYTQKSVQVASFSDIWRQYITNTYNRGTTNNSRYSNGNTYTPNTNNTSTSTPTSSTLSAIENSVHQQINQLRSGQGLPPLQRNSAMDNQARIHSQNMASGQVPFGHIGFAQRVQATGISYSSAAENVAYNQGYSDPATQAVQGWRNSPGHWTNIKGNYNLTGIGVAKNSKGEVYFTQIFILK
ncbi:CAP domain-containing protein [Nostoc sp. FACHB-152]|nr:CAP domain-containing protein [Nostoc sp. FACHB-152]MBD2469240.1 CAP domain-containing protein [Nostoc sp. FACHB-145]